MARVLLLICLYGLAAQTNAGQFYPSFYSTPSFPPVNPFLYNQAQFYSAPFPQSPYDLPPVLRFQPIIPQPYTLNINTQAAFNTKSNNQESQATTEKPQTQQTLQTAQTPLHQSVQPAFPNDFVGYSYRTQFGDGATSTVVFFTGGHPHDIPQTRQRITVASDSLDPQRLKEAEQSIDNILSERQGKSLSSPVNHHNDFSQVITSLLENPSIQTGTYYYYQSDEALHPSEGISTTTHKNEEETTTKKEDEATTQNEEDVGEETEPPLKHDAVESTVSEQRSVNNDESESTSTSSTEGTANNESSSTEGSNEGSSESSSEETETTTSSR